MSRKTQWLVLASMALTIPFLIVRYDTGSIVALLFLPVLYLMLFRPVAYFLFVITVFNNIPYWVQEKTRVSIGPLPITVPELLLGGTFISCLLYFTFKNRL